MRKSITILGLMSVLGLAAACDPGDTGRAGVGALIGCAAGEIVEDGKCFEGAVIGGVAGASTDNVGL